MTDEALLKGRVALVTGAAAGIGHGIATRLARAGAAVVIADIDPQVGAVVASALSSEGLLATFMYCDVTQRADVTAAVNVVVEMFGSIDIVVNNAYRGQGFARIEDKSDDTMRDGLTMCLYAAKWSMEEAFPHMKARRWGRIINIASLNGVNAHLYTAEYNVGKEALRAYTRSAAREWAQYGICANIICPAAVSAAYRRFEQASPTNAAAVAAANPMGRVGDPEADIGGVAVFLASDDARYLTGNTLFVDGGAHINGVQWAPTLTDGDAHGRG